MRRKYVMIGIIFILFIIAGVCYSCTYKDNNTSAVLVTSLEDNEDIESEEKEEIDNSIQEDEIVEHTSDDIQPDIYIHICGAVVNPGVYQIENDARLVDLIELAGGLQPEAAGDYINQAQPITDGQRVYIPTREEVKELSTGDYIEGDKSNQEIPSEETKLININQADENELMSLPGVGQSKAGSIIEYRNTKGNFKTIEELMNIPGIKEGLFQQIFSYITVK